MVQISTSALPNDETAELSRGRARRLLSKAADIVGQLAALAVILLFFWWIVPGDYFFTVGNIENILIQSVVFIMASLGMTMIIITGGIDLAAGSIIALSMVLTGMILEHGGGIHARWYYTPLAVIGASLACAMIGAIQGGLITGLRVVPFIITLGGLVGIRGFAKQVSDHDISVPGWLHLHLLHPVQTTDFSWELFPVGVWATLGAAVAAAGLLRFTKLGRHIYAIGSSEATARLCGIPVWRTKILVYTIGGFFAGLAGVLEFSKFGYAQRTGAEGYELYIIAACVIGGTSLRGGVGGIFGTVVGGLVIGTLTAGAQQAGWQKQRQEMVIGAIIIVAVALDQLRNRRNSRA